MTEEPKIAICEWNVDIEEWVAFMPAPSILWRPYCFNPEPDNKCRGMCHPLAYKGIADCCKKCPYRKME